MVKKLYFFTILNLSIVFGFIQSSHAMTVSCDRKSNDSSGFTSKSAWESWYPKNVNLNASDFKIPDDTSTKKVERIFKSHGTTVFWRLLPNGKLIAGIEQVSGYKATAVVRYKCDKTSLDVRVELAKSSTGESAKKPENNQEEPNIGNQSDAQICNKATVAFGRWEATNGRWAKYVSEAKRRGLSCGVEEETADKTSKIFKLDKAKSNCTELGFKLGTEKHGDCVMKLIDQ